MSKYELNFKREILGELISDTIGKLKVVEKKCEGEEKARIVQIIDRCYDIRQDGMFETQTFSELCEFENHIKDVRATYLSY